MSESEDITIDILERCISQSEKSIWQCVKSSRESGQDKNELGCGIRPKMNVSDRIFGCFGNTVGFYEPHLAQLVWCWVHKTRQIQRAPSSQQLRH